VSNYQYICSIHTFGGIIETVPAPPPPPPPADFTVTSPGFFFLINGEVNPTLTLQRGKTYTFDVSTDCGVHPFFIVSGGVSNNNACSGIVTYTVPNDLTNTEYICSIHAFGGTIQTVAAPPPPPVQILSLSVGTNLVVKSTGTNNWTVIPEFKTNITTTNWFALTVQTNIFLNGTNETYCGRPPGDEVFIRVRNQSN
jgi:hypothetical protein